MRHKLFVVLAALAYMGVCSRRLSVLLPAKALPDRVHEHAGNPVGSFTNAGGHWTGFPPSNIHTGKVYGMTAERKQQGSSSRLELLEREFGLEITVIHVGLDNYGCTRARRCRHVLEKHQEANDPFQCRAVL